MKVITELEQQIESGDYMKEARSWYADQYLGGSTQAVAALIFFCITSVAAYIITDSMMEKYFAVKYPVPIYAKDQVNLRSQIKSLSKGDESIDVSIAKYLLSEYVIMREEYISRGISTMNERLAALKSSSSRKVFADYANYVDPQKNPDSPIIKYKLSTDRLISIKAVEFPIVDRPGSVKITFKSTERNADGESISYYIAHINFILSNITSVVDTREALSFIVTSYVTKEIKNYVQ